MMANVFDQFDTAIEPAPEAGSQQNATPNIFDQFDAPQTQPQTVKSPAMVPNPPINDLPAKLSRAGNQIMEPAIGLTQLGTHLIGYGKRTMDALAQKHREEYEQMRVEAGLPAEASILHPSTWDIPGTLGNILSPANAIPGGAATKVAGRFVKPIATIAENKAARIAAGEAAQRFVLPSESLAGLATRGTIGGAAYGASQPVTNLPEGDSFTGAKAGQALTGALFGAIGEPALVRGANLASKYNPLAGYDPLAALQRWNPAARAARQFTAEGRTQGAANQLGQHFAEANEDVDAMLKRLANPQAAPGTASQLMQSPTATGIEQRLEAGDPVFAQEMERQRATAQSQLERGTERIIGGGSPMALRDQAVAEQQAAQQALTQQETGANVAFERQQRQAAAALEQAQTDAKWHAHQLQENARFRFAGRLGELDDAESQASQNFGKMESSVNEMVANAEEHAKETASVFINRDPEARDQAGVAARTILERAYDSAKTIERKLWSIIPKETPIILKNTLAQQEELKKYTGSQDIPGEIQKYLDRWSERGEDNPWTAGELLTDRSNLQAAARDARGGEKPNSRLATMYDMLADGLLDDLAGLPGSDAARYYSYALRQRFRQGYAGEILRLKGTGENAVRPALTLARAGATGQESALKLEELEEAVKPIPQENPAYVPPAPHNYPPGSRQAATQAKLTNLVAEKAEYDALANAAKNRFDKAFYSKASNDVAFREWVKQYNPENYSERLWMLAQYRSTQMGNAAAVELGNAKRNANLGAESNINVGDDVRELMGKLPSMRGGRVEEIFPDPNVLDPAFARNLARLDNGKVLPVKELELASKVAGEGIAPTPTVAPSVPTATPAELSNRAKTRAAIAALTPEKPIAPAPTTKPLTRQQIGEETGTVQERAERAAARMAAQAEENVKMKSGTMAAPGIGDNVVIDFGGPVLPGGRIESITEKPDFLGKTAKFAKLDDGREIPLGRVRIPKPNETVAQSLIEPGTPLTSPREAGKVAGIAAPKAPIMSAPKVEPSVPSAPKTEIPNGAAQEMRAAQERFLRINAQQFIDPLTGLADAKRIETYMRDNPRLLRRFPDLAGDLEAASNATQAMKAAGAKGKETLGEQKKTFAATMKDIANQRQSLKEAAVEKLIDRKTGLVKHADVRGYIRRNQEALDTIPGLAGEIRTAANRSADFTELQAALKTKLQKAAEVHENKLAQVKKGRTDIEQATFAKVAGVEDPATAVSRALRGVNPVHDLTELARLAIRGGDDAMAGFRSLIHDEGIKQSTRRGIIDFSELNDFYTKAINNRGQKLTDMLTSPQRIGSNITEIMPHDQVADMLRIIGIGMDRQRAPARARVIADITTPIGHMLESMFRTIGAHYGALLTPGAGIHGAAAGSRTAVDVLRMPASRIGDLYKQAFLDHDLMVALLKRINPKTENKTWGFIRNKLIRAGILSGPDINRLRPVQAQ